MSQIGTDALRIGIPKEKRLQNDVKVAFIEAGLQISRVGKSDRDGRIRIEDAQNNATYNGIIARQSDLLAMVGRGQLSLAVAGRDCLSEFNLTAMGNNDPWVQELGCLSPFGKAGIWVASRADQDWNGLSDLNGQAVYTPFPKTARAWLRENGVFPSDIIQTDGDTESITRFAGESYLIEIVETGGTLKATGFERRVQLCDISPVLVTGDGTNMQEQVQGIAERLVQAVAWRLG